MDGVHDLGGKPGFGRVSRSGSAYPFHERWHASVFAMVGIGARSGAWTNTDRFRHAVERIDPEAYLHHGYYGRWLGGLEILLEEQAVVLRAEIDKKVLEFGGNPNDLVAARPASRPDRMGPLPSGPGSDRDIAAGPKFLKGDCVITQEQVTSGHTRLPAYARGKQGVILNSHGGWVFPDTNAHGSGEQPKYLYTVRFSSEVLWNRSGFSVCLDLFEPYLLADRL